MKRLALFILFGLGVLGLEAQTPVPPTPPSPEQRPWAGTGTSELGMANLSFTNSAGQRYTVNQLAGSLQNLQGAVNQALPLLSAFNENYSNTVSANQGTLAGAISGILSGNRNGASQQGATNSSRLSSLLGALQGMLGNTNGPATAVNTNTVNGLLALQGELQPVVSTLRSLNLQPYATSTTSTSPGNRISYPPPAPPPRPTGR